MDIRALQEDFYGDNIRWFIGVVVDNQDPLRVGRVRVRIYGIHNSDVNEVPQASLPWAQVIIPSTEDGVSGLGRATGLKQGAQVFGFFMDGAQSQTPIVMGSMLRFEDRTDTRDIQDPTVRTHTQSEGQNTIVDQVNTPSASTAVGSSNSERAFNFLISNGFTPIQASAVIGNFLQESNMDPTVVSSFPGEESIGIAQWNPAAGRRQQLEDFASSRGLDYLTLETQLQFFLYDFSTFSPGFFGYNQFMQMTNLNNATDFFCDKYERPAAAHANKPARRAYARQILEAYNVN